MSAPLRVVKVGGSLFDLPDLGPRLRSWLGSTRTVLVPGGGPTAEAVRTLDTVHRLGEEAAHWLALQALSVNAHVLARLLPEAPVRSCLPPAAEPGAWFILDALPFLQDDDRLPGHLPHTWEVTSDSLAVRVAIRAGATDLVLLKSVSWPAVDDWAAATRARIVDGFFVEALRSAPELRVQVVNFRKSAGSSHE